MTPLELAAFAVRAARRNLWLCVAVGLFFASAGFVVVSAIPSIYQASAKIYMSQSTSALTVGLASGRREDPSQGLRGVEEAVFNQDNIKRLVVEAALAESWDATRTWPLRLKDQLFAAVFGSLSLEDKRHALAETLPGSLGVNFEGSSSVRFTGQWREPYGALRLTELMQRNFLEARAREETEAIRRAVALLEEQAQQADDALAPAIEEVQRVVSKVKTEQGGARAVQPASEEAAPPRRSSSSEPAAPALPKVAVIKLGEKLADNRRAQHAAEESWRRHTATLKQQLSDLRVTFGPEHPNVRQQEAKIEAASAEPAELVELRNKEAELSAELDALTQQEGGEAASRSKNASSLRRSGAAAEAMKSIRMLDESKAEAPEVVAARVRLDSVLSNADDLSNRLHGARVELATTQASAKFRYTTVESAKLPRKPVKPNRPLLYLAVFAGALLIGLLAGALRELLGGAIMEPWQARRLGMDVLAEVDLNDLR